MSIFLFIIVHILLGIGLIYFYGKLPKALTVLLSVVFIMGFLYWGKVLITMFLN